jgi:hypothetical protein
MKATTIISNAVITTYKKIHFKPTMKVVIFQTGLIKVNSTLQQTLFLTCGDIS